ncbi:hypothetical protein SSP24_04060 [Streptomyces spinoverrucosus]|uniref:Uncharacterized protein n=1 Tax=Streptomyces spinoverrucosus TaxID=284043 RepID=A0A4Y3VB24_9ACTN|nr:hypothetical protein SSP24_04060 [Streptomyces spinoverrucosus]GHB40723.1 hypothetical protein GCM10010397_08540 [Streptomyces spinoverrucosus]
MWHRRRPGGHGRGRAREAGGEGADHAAESEQGEDRDEYAALADLVTDSSQHGCQDGAREQEAGEHPPHSELARVDVIAQRLQTGVHHGLDQGVRGRGDR